MAVFFELLDTLSGNFISDFDTESEAFEALATYGCEQGLASLQDLALFRFEDNRPMLVAEGEELIARVKEEPSWGKANIVTGG